MIGYGDLKFVAISIDLETEFSELKDPVTLVDSIKNREI